MIQRYDYTTVENEEGRISPSPSISFALSDRRDSSCNGGGERGDERRDGREEYGTTDSIPACFQSTLRVSEREGHRNPWME